MVKLNSNLESWKIKAFANLVLSKGMSCVVCVLKKDDIFIDWSSGSIVGSIILPKPLIEYGLSSNQIRTNDIRNVVLLVVVPRAYTIISFGSDQCYHLVHIIVEFH